MNEMLPPSELGSQQAVVHSLYCNQIEVVV
jgi:hypothetical protein